MATLVSSRRLIHHANILSQPSGDIGLIGLAVMVLSFPPPSSSHLSYFNLRAKISFLI